MNIVFNRKKIVNFLMIITLVLIFIHTVILCIYYYVDDPEKFDFVRMFDLDMERNIPTLFSSLILVISGFLFYLLSCLPKEQKEGHRKYWLGLSFIFTFLSFDESAKIHEQIGDLTEKFFDTTGYLHYPWVISYAILVVILAMLYFRFFWKMRFEIFWSFIGSAVMYLSGAIGFDILGGMEAELHSTDTILYSILYTIEESLEMFGVIYLIYILLGLLDTTKVKLEKK